MAFLYRRDIELLGYDIEVRKIKKNGFLSVLAYADLHGDNQVIPCLATFFRFRKGVRIDLICDEELEYQIMNDYISFMKKYPMLFMELIARNIIKMVSSICGLIAYIYLGYILVTSSNSIANAEFSKIVGMCTCIILVMMIRTLLNTI